MANFHNRYSSYLLIIILLLLLNGCSKNELTGIWIVDKVKVGNEEMTPVARWMQFNSDYTQISGNGWMQHSYGSWEFSSESNSLKINNANGLADEFEPFTVEISDNNMTWKRTEEGQEVEVFLSRTNERPASPGDSLLGVWDLVKVTENEKDITKDHDPENKRYLFMRWDKMFIERNTPEGRLAGIYRINGHSPRAEFVYYGEDCIREEWMFETKDDSLTMKGTESGSVKGITKLYKRINYFPQ